MQKAINTNQHYKFPTRLGQAGFTAFVMCRQELSEDFIIPRLYLSSLIILKKKAIAGIRCGRVI